MKIVISGEAISIITVLNLCSIQTVQADALRPVEIALGNWPPVIEETRSSHGAVTEKITTVLRRMGYQPTYSFMPWSQAEGKVARNETDSDTRITFPYLETPIARKEALEMIPNLRNLVEKFSQLDINNADLTALIQDYSDNPESLATRAQQLLKTKE